MGLASGKAKLKLIDIESSAERDFIRHRATPTLGNQPSSQESAARMGVTSTASDGATEIGCSLREARERSGQSLQDASSNLRIRLAYLRAIENGDFKALPGMTYAIGYVRTYAQYLGLDVERAISLFKAEASELNGPRQLVFPSPAPEGKVPGGALMFVAAFLAIFAYAGWYYVTDSGCAVAGYTLAVPEARQAWLDAKPSGASTSDGFTSTAVASSQGIPLPESSDEPTGTGTPKIVISNEAPARTAAAIAAQVTVATPIVTAAPISAGPRPEMAKTEAAPTVVMSPNSGSASAAVPSLEPARPNAPALVQVAATTSGNSSQGEGSQSEGSQRVGSGSIQAQALVPRPSPTEVSIPQAPAMRRLEVSSAHASAVPSRTPPTSAAAGMSDRARIIIQASEASWVQVRAADSTTVMTKVMRAGDTYAVPNRDGLRLFTGNAGALTILVDGKAIPKLGGTGQIARNIDLKPETLRQQNN